MKVQNGKINVFGMTATDVVLRFLKENGLYGMLHKKIYDRCRRMLPIFEGNYENETKKLKKVHGNKSFQVDLILKCQSSCLDNFFDYNFWDVYTLYHPYRKIDIAKEFHKFLRKNVKGNYMKTMIRGIYDEKYRSYRNGYHVLNFEWKDKQSNQ